MASRARLAVASAVLAAGAVAAFTLSGQSGPGPQAAPTSLPTSSKTPILPAQCLQPPPAITTPAWYPSDLPMPAGSYVSEVPAAGSGLRRVVWTAKVSLRDFVRHALTVWPKQGWRLGRGESEPGEAEDNFIKTRDRYGLFRAQSAYCDPGMTWVLLILSDPSTAPPTPSPSR